MYVLEVITIEGISYAAQQYQVISFEGYSWVAYAQIVCESILNMAFNIALKTKILKQLEFEE